MLGVKPHNPFTLADLSVDCVIKTLVFNNPTTTARKLVVKLNKSAKLPKTLVTTLLEETRPIYLVGGPYECRYFYESYHTTVIAEFSGVMSINNRSYLDQTRDIPTNVFKHDSWLAKHTTSEVVGVRSSQWKVLSTILYPNQFWEAGRV